MVGIALSVIQVLTIAVVLVVLYDVRQKQRRFYKATDALINNLIVRVCELEKESEKHGS